MVLVLSLVVVFVTVVVLLADDDEEAEAEAGPEPGSVVAMVLVILTVTISSTVEEVTQSHVVVRVSMTVGRPLVMMGSAVTSLSAGVELLHEMVVVT